MGSAGTLRTSDIEITAVFFSPASFRGFFVGRGFGFAEGAKILWIRYALLS